MINIYTDGGCRGNPGPGAWAYLIIKKDEIISQNSNFSAHTTNNIMELTAVIEALKNCEQKKINLYTDSQYVKNGITKWVHNWIKNNWKTAAKKPVKNRKLWEILYDLSLKKIVTWKWVKGHSTNKFNNAVDELLNQTMDEHLRR